MSLFSSRIGLRLTSFPSLGLAQDIGKRFSHELAPRYKHVGKKQKGRVTVRTGGSIKGSTLKFGEYGIRLKSMGTRMSAKQLKEADIVIMRLMRPIGGQLFRRICTNIAICTKGNETRMGKGKGGFDYWAARVPTGKIIFEVGGGSIREEIARDAFRKATAKLPGVFEFVQKTDLPRVSLKEMKEATELVDHLELLKKNPSKKFLNALKAKLPEYKDFNGRSN